MYRKRKIEKRYIVIILLMVVTLFLASFTFFIKDSRNLSIIEKTVKDSGTFIGKIVVTPINFIGDKINEAKEKKNIYNKYKKIKKKYQKTKILEAKYKESLKEINNLEKMLELNNNLMKSSYLNATVVNRNIGYWYNNITIDKGSKNGITKDMAVITSEGLIGKITTVSKFSSTVKLLTNSDVNNKISVKIEIKDKFVYGILTGYNSSTNSFQIEGISENTEIPKDSFVTTTGMGDIFPSGILIGSVKRVSTDNFKLARTVEVEPYVNYDDINYVTILKREYNK